MRVANCGLIHKKMTVLGAFNLAISGVHRGGGVNALQSKKINIFFRNFAYA